jgi:pantoate--beta-alanine ligase
MAVNLNFPIRILVAPTLREADGLAMSSRNKYLQGTLRMQARVLWRSIQEVRKAVRKRGAGIPAAILRRRVESLVGAEPAARLDYVAFFDPETLAPVRTVRRGTRMALAVFVGKTRLIDNAEV